jgi:hypothetical protein
VITKAPEEVEDGPIARIVLPSGHVVLFDEIDRSLVEAHHWCADVAKHTVYARSGGQGRKTIRMHRLILAAPEGVLVDHINGNGLDNRRANLRLASRTQNGANARLSQRNTSGFKGVTWRTDLNRWQAYIKIGKKREHLGYFITAEAAAAAYDRRAGQVWGEFATLNGSAS